MIPTGPIYTRLRESLLSTFPTSITLNSRHRSTYAEWLLNSSGSYVVTSFSSSEFIFRASPVDVSRALLTEIELFSNHCFEHLQELAAVSSDNRVRSDSWNVVTTYYFGFFAAQIFARLVGRPVIYLDQEHIERIKTQGGQTSKLGVGSYQLERLTVVPSHVEEFRMKKTGNSRIHEATWTKAFSFLENLLGTSALLSNPEEVLLYSSITTPYLRPIYKGREGWPSLIRTKANYSPGYSYLGVENNLIAKSKKLIENWKHVDLASVAQKLHVSVQACAPPTRGNYASHVRLMHDASQAIFIVARQLYSELLTRTKINRTWENRRSAFRQTMTIDPAEYPAIGVIY